MKFITLDDLELFLKESSDFDLITKSKIINFLYHDQKLSRDQILIHWCEKINFPKNDLRLRQILRVKDLHKPFQDILLKGIHCLDYLSLLSRLNLEEQGLFWEKGVKKYKLNYNYQKKYFEIIYDLFQISKKSFSSFFQNLNLDSIESRAQLEAHLMRLRYPHFDLGKELK